MSLWVYGFGRLAVEHYSSRYEEQSWTSVQLFLIAVTIE